MARTAAAKKDDAKKDDVAPAAETKPTRQRTTQKLTMSQTKVLEAQYDTRIKDAKALDGKLDEILVKFGDDTESYVPTQVTEARAKLADGIAAMEESKALFAEIGEKYRSFFG